MSHRPEILMELVVGHAVTESRQFSQADFDAFARLSGDDNPIHVDPAFAAASAFGRTVAHGMLLYGVICGLLSRHFPGAIQLEQSLKFPAPTYAGELMRFTAEVVGLMPDQRSARLAVRIENPQRRLTCDGETVLQWPREGTT